MFRYHASVDSVSLGNPNNRAQFGDLSVTTFVVPLWAKGHEERVQSSAVGEGTENTRKLVLTESKDFFTRHTHSNGFDYNINRNSVGPHSALPIIMVPNEMLTPSQTHALVDAFKTGSCNSTSGGLVGAGFGWMVGGLPGSVTGALWGAGIFGGGSALVQFVNTMYTNSFRRIAADANQILIEAQMNGINQQVLHSFQRLCNQVVGSQQRDLVQQMLAVFEAEFGRQAAAGLRAMFAAI